MEEQFKNLERKQEEGFEKLSEEMRAFKHTVVDILSSSSRSTSTSSNGSFRSAIMVKIYAPPTV